MERCLRQLKILTKNLSKHYVDMKEPRGRGDGALNQQSVPVGHQGLLPSSELTLHGMLRMLRWSEGSLLVHVSVWMRERRKW